MPAVSVSGSDSSRSLTSKDIPVSVPVCLGSRKLAAKLSNPKDKKSLELLAAAWDAVANEREARWHDQNPFEKIFPSF